MSSLGALPEFASSNVHGGEEPRRKKKAAWSPWPSWFSSLALRRKYAMSTGLKSERVGLFA
jgi:hypothetical protein